MALVLGGIHGGIVGNMIDRLFRGSVVDFLDFEFGGWHWPAFNVADSAISVGVVLVLLASFFCRRLAKAVLARRESRGWQEQLRNSAGEWRRERCEDGMSMCGSTGPDLCLEERGSGAAGR